MYKNDIFYTVNRLSVLVVIVVLYLLAAIYFPKVFIYLTYEDLYGEWAQCLFFAVALFYSVRLAYCKSRYRIFFGLLALACFYVFMEEISWGQRLFNITTPDYFKQNNLQKEMNLHNLITGPYATTLKSFLEYLISTVLIGYGLVYPLLLQQRFKPAAFIEERLRIPVPPFYLTPYFMVAAFLEPEPFLFNEAEVAELVIAVTLAYLSIHYFFVHQHDLSVTSSDSLWKSNVLAVYNRRLWGIFFLVIASSWLITQLLMQTGDMNRLFSIRLKGGYLKFATRYESKKQWGQANELLLSIAPLLKNKAVNSKITHRIARNFHKLGDVQKFNNYTQKAISLELQELKKNTAAISRYLSLSKNFQQKGDKEQADLYGQKAYEEAFSRVKKKLRSASRAYWLAKTMVNLKLHKEAYLQFRKAVILKPENVVYHKAYLKQKRLIEALQEEKNNSAGMD